MTASTVPPCPTWCDLPPGHPVVDVRADPPLTVARILSLRLRGTPGAPSAPQPDVAYRVHRQTIDLPWQEDWPAEWAAVVAVERDGEVESGLTAFACCPHDQPPADYEERWATMWDRHRPTTRPPWSRTVINENALIIDVCPVCLSKLHGRTAIAAHDALAPLQSSWGRRIFAYCTGPIIAGPVGTGDTADRLRDVLAVLEDLGLLVDRTT